MKVLFFVSDFPVRSETFILTQIAGLLERGHEVHICANELHGAFDLHSDFTRHRLLERARRRRRATWGNIAQRFATRLGILLRNAFREPSLVVNSLNVLRFGKKALSLDLMDMALCFADRPQYDIVHCHFGPNGNDAALLLELGVLHGRLIVTFHSYDVLAGLQTQGRIYRPLMRRADAVHSISEYNRRALESMGFAPERIYYHPMGIGLKHFAPRAERPGSAGPVRILTVARLAPAKGLEYALAALADLNRDVPELQWHYRIIGGGELLDSLRKRAERLRINDRVEFTGPKDQSEVRRALSETDVFLLPSLAEALPIAIMEAMASEVPVIATDVGGVAELIRDGETGRLVPAGNAEALRSALRSVIETTSRERRRLGVAGRTLVLQRHDTDRTSERLIEHYRELLAGEATAPRDGARANRLGAPAITGLSNSGE